MFLTSVCVRRNASCINHSCCPNAAYSFTPNGTVTVRSVRALQAGEELTIAYTDLLQTLDERQQCLLERYAFECCCSRCKDESPSPGDWFLDAIAAEGKPVLCNPRIEVSNPLDDLLFTPIVWFLPTLLLRRSPCCATLLQTLILPWFLYAIAAEGYPHTVVK